MLGEAADGSTQLPDFQRGWVWDDDHVRSLLASISLGYPIGAVMMLRAGGEAPEEYELVQEDSQVSGSMATLPTP